MALTKIGKEGITGISNASDATAITITSSELVGIGTASPQSLLHLAANGPYITFEDLDNNQDWQIQATAWFAIRDQTNNAERMRIDNGGKVYVGKTTIATGTAGIALMPTGEIRGTVSGGAAARFSRLSSDGDVVSFEKDGSAKGNISVTSSATAYNTSSDYRLKENVNYDWDATTRLKQLKPARFNFIIDETNTPVDGFIAHEVSSIVPEAITGTKDAMTTEVLYVEGDELPEGVSIGDVKEASVPDYQGIDQSKLVPLLVKTIQELEARITALEA